MRLQGACLAVTDSALTGLPVSSHGGPCRVRHVVGVGQITVQCRGGSFDHVHEAPKVCRDGWPHRFAQMAAWTAAFEPSMPTTIGGAKLDHPWCTPGLRAICGRCEAIHATLTMAGQVGPQTLVLGRGPLVTGSPVEQPMRGMSPPVRNGRTG